MIHAFFNIRLDDAYLAERTGQFVRDAEEARAVARTIVRRLVVQHGGEPRLLNAVMAVTDADGASLFDLSFFEALYVPVALPQREGTDLCRAAIRAPGKVLAGFGAVAARMRASAMRPRLHAAVLRVRALFTAAADLLSFRRDPRQRFALGLEPTGFTHLAGATDAPSLPPLRGRAALA